MLTHLPSNPVQVFCQGLASHVNIFWAYLRVDKKQKLILTICFWSWWKEIWKWSGHIGFRLMNSKMFKNYWNTSNLFKFQAWIAQLVAHRLGTGRPRWSRQWREFILTKKEFNSNSYYKSKVCKEYNLVVPTSQKDRCRYSTWKLPTEGDHETCKNLKKLYNVNV